MKSLAFFCWVVLAMFPARAEVTFGAPAPVGTGAATAPNWSAAIQKFSKEAPDAAQDAIDTRVLIDHLSDNDPVVKSGLAPSAAASAPAPRPAATVGKPGELKATLAGASPSELNKPGGDEDWATTVRHSVRDIVKPFQEFLPGSSDASASPGADGAAAGPVRGAYAQSGPAPPRKSEEQRRRENIQSDYLISQFIDELLPWAAGALVLLALGYVGSLWLGYVKNKPSVSLEKRHRHRSGSGKKRRRSSI